jgi:YHS domain-containing protein
LTYHPSDSIIKAQTRTNHIEPKQEDKTMKLEFRTKTNANGNGYYLCVDTNAKTFSRVPDGWVSKDVPVVAKHDMDTIKAQAIADGYTEV